ncbi:MAG: hypothetical protein Q8P05_02115 [Candidatus Diapherotrites archaeon]|nr:hypothetical protein [Candidatus Diapherotrites archaeon]
MKADDRETDYMETAETILKIAGSIVALIIALALIEAARLVAG